MFDEHLESPPSTVARAKAANTKLEANIQFIIIEEKASDLAAASDLKYYELPAQSICLTSQNATF